MLLQTVLLKNKNISLFSQIHLFIKISNTVAGSGTYLV